MSTKRIQKRKCRKCLKTYPAAHFQENKVTHLFCAFCRQSPWRG